MKKKGISLIVLVITIIVMVILAASVVITLSNTGIIDKANEAVNKSNKKEIEHLVVLAWADAYSEGKTSEAQLKEAVEKALSDSKVDASDYNIIVTENGVTVEDKDETNNTSKGINKYGFYYDDIYKAKANEDLDMGYAFHEDGSVEAFFISYDEELEEDMYYPIMYLPAGYATYSNGKIILQGTTVNVVNEGNSIELDGEMPAAKTNNVLHGIYRGYTYSATVEGEGTYTLILDANNELKVYKDGTLTISGTVASVANDRILTVDGEEVVRVITTDGTKLLAKEVIFTIVGEPKGEVTPAVPFAGAVITPVAGSSVEAIKAGNPKTGDTIEYNGYTYKCNQVYFMGQWATPDTITGDAYWGVIANDTTRSSYAPIEAILATKNVTGLWNTYYNCTNLTTAPVLSPNVKELSCTFVNCSSLEIDSNYYIPESVTYMFGTFSGCSSLKNAPVIPEDVYYMEETFFNCTSLQTAPVIPSKVTNMDRTFQGCTSLTGNVTINATNLATYTKCFYNTTLPIQLAGSCSSSVLTSIAATSDSGNVTVE